MAGGTAASQTPTRQPGKAPAPMSSSNKQKSIMSFFQKSSPAAPKSSPSSTSKVSSDPCLQETTKANFLPKASPAGKLATPVPTSDAIEPSSSQENGESTPRAVAKYAADSPTIAIANKSKSELRATPTGSSPTRKVSLLILSLTPVF